MTIIRVVRNPWQKEIFCFDEQAGEIFYIPLMDDEEIIDYIKKLYPEKYKWTYILLKISELERKKWQQ